MTYWIVATGCKNSANEKEALLTTLKRRVASMCEPDEPPVKFDVPDGESALKFGSFDDLIRLTDDMQKYDSQVESIARRLERMYLEVEPAKSADPLKEFKVLSQTKTMPFDKYLREWRWDDAKYPKMRGLSNNLTLLLSVANKLDEEARNKASQYSELKTVQNNLTKKETGNMMSRDLVDVLTPSVVSEGDFVYTPKLTTVVCIVPRANEDQFLKSYEKYAEYVVPKSAMKFKSIKEEDGVGIWRVVMFRTSVDAFMKKCREDRAATARNFEYSPEAYEKVKTQREEIKKECERQEKMMKGFCKASLSDVMIAWVHIKAMRVFVESVLRFGVPPHFASFVIQPKPAQMGPLRKGLAEALGKPGTDSMGDGGEDEDYFPYVSLNFTPFSVAPK